MGETKGKCIPLSPGRRLVYELMRYAKAVPSLPLSRVARIPEVAAARGNTSWMSVFMKAFALTSMDVPELRRLWVPYPWRHLYEHPVTGAAVLFEREVAGEPAVLAAKIRTPESRPLADLDAHLKTYREKPVQDVPAFRQLLRLATWPRLIGRFYLWKALSFNGKRRAGRMGTFMISSLGNFGVEQQHPLTAMTTYFSFGPVSPAGEVNLLITYDHRVMDGRSVSRALVRLEEVLNGAILAELRAMSPAKVAA